MKSDRQPDIDRLDQELDRLANGSSPISDHTSREDSEEEAARRLHELYVQGQPPEPSAAFVTQLEENLMQIANPAHPSRLVSGLPDWNHQNRDSASTPPNVPREPAYRRPLNWLGGLAAAAIVIVALAVGYAAYRSAPPQNNEQSTTLPAAGVVASPTGSPAPALAGCTVAPRPTGSVEQLMGTKPTDFALLPRWGQDPAYESYQPQPVDGDLLLKGTTPPNAATRAGITNTLKELTACRFYATVDGRRTDLNGRYAALFSDNYFRRELSGFSEAGIDPQTLAFWTPQAEPTIAVAGVLSDGRILAALNTSTDPYHPKWRYAMIFVQDDSRWLVDEFGMITLTGLPPASPTPAQTAPTSIDIALYDPPSSTSFLCDALGSGTPTPCFHNYWFDATTTSLLADTDVTIRLHNAGEQPKRFTIAALGVDINVAPGGTEEVKVNAPAGEYQFLVYEGNNLTAIAPGKINFVGSGTPPGHG